VHRILPVSERHKVIELIKQMGCTAAYNARAPPYFKI
jgi:hypothetical protein